VNQRWRVQGVKAAAARGPASREYRDPESNGFIPLTSNLPRLVNRFALSGYIGTIRYVGEMVCTDGVWLGVEWDDSNRGNEQREV
jgi:hypothetical protein